MEKVALTVVSKGFWNPKSLESGIKCSCQHFSEEKGNIIHTIS